MHIDTDRKECLQAIKRYDFKYYFLKYIYYLIYLKFNKMTSTTITYFHSNQASSIRLLLNPFHVKIIEYIINFISYAKSKDYLKNKTILIKAVLGSFGQAMTEKLLTQYNPKSIRVYSRDELSFDTPH